MKHIEHNAFVCVGILALLSSCALSYKEHDWCTNVTTDIVSFAERINGTWIRSRLGAGTSSAEVNWFADDSDVIDMSTLGIIGLVVNESRVRLQVCFTDIEFGVFEELSVWTGADRSMSIGYKQGPMGIIDTADGGLETIQGWTVLKLKLKGGGARELRVDDGGNNLVWVSRGESDMSGVVVFEYVRTRMVSCAKK